MTDLDAEKTWGLSIDPCLPNEQSPSRAGFKDCVRHQLQEEHPWAPDTPVLACACLQGLVCGGEEPHMALVQLFWKTVFPAVIFSCTRGLVPGA